VTFTVEQAITVKYWKKSELLEIEWESSIKSDMVADSVCLLALQIKDKPSPQLVEMI
jgi:hypothetical protein